MPSAGFEFLRAALIVLATATVVPAAAQVPAGLDLEAPLPTATEWTRFSRKLSFTTKYKRDDRSQVTSGLQLTATYRPTRVLRLDVDTKALGVFREQRSDRAQLRLRRFYVTLGDADTGLSFQAGRLRQRDKREWYYDDNIDGVRLSYSRTVFGFELVSGQRKALDDELLGDRDVDVYRNTIANAGLELGAHHDFDLFYLRQDHDADGERREYHGARLSGEWLQTLEYWADVAVLRGALGAAEYRGVATDIGFTLNPDVPLRPALTVAWARGSGDDDIDDEVVRAFHQSGLADNERRLGGVQKVRYYGSALDPELSNLRVATVGLAVRPWRAGSLEVLRHEYRPDVRIAGIQRLGTAWDVVLGLKASKAFRLAATIGSFTSDAPAVYANERVVEIKFGYVF